MTQSFIKTTIFIESGSFVQGTIGMIRKQTSQENCSWVTLIKLDEFFNAGILLSNKILKRDKFILIEDETELQSKEREIQILINHAPPLETRSIILFTQDLETLARHFDGTSTGISWLDEAFARAKRQ